MDRIDVSGEVKTGITQHRFHNIDDIDETRRRWLAMSYFCSVRGVQILSVIE